MTSMTAPGTTRQATAQRIGTPLLLTLGPLAAIAPFATDLYLPAFPQISRDLSASATGVQLTLTAFLVGLTAGQLILGPLSDRVGRRVPLLVGLAVCVAAGAVAVLAPTIGVLIAARVIQGLAGAAGMVIGRAVIADLAAGGAAAQAYSLTMAVVGVAPVVAPVVGSVFAGPLGWRGLLGVVMGLTVVMLLAVLFLVPESMPKALRGQSRVTGRGGTASALGSRAFIAPTTVCAFAFAAMLAYVAASPFVYQGLMGLSTLQYGALFGVNALGLASMSVASGRLAATHPVGRLLAIGLALMLAAAIALVALVLLAVPPILFSIPLFVLVSALGLVIGNATALAIAAVPSATGSASAVLGAAQFGFGAIASALVGIGGGRSAVPMGIVVAACVLLSVGGALLAPRTRPAA